MTTIQLEAEVSTEQLLRAVEQLPPREFAAFFAQLLDRVHTAALAAPMPTEDDAAQSAAERLAETNPYLAAAGMFADDSFAAEVAAYITAQREREREEAGREAGV